MKSFFLALLALFGFGSFLAAPKPKTQIQPIVITPSATSTKAYTITLIPLPKKVSLPPPPSLDRLIRIPSYFSADAAAQARFGIATLVKKLKANPGDEWSWIELGIYRNDLEDTQGAREAWEYAQKLAPNDPVPAQDLKNLHAGSF